MSISDRKGSLELEVSNLGPIVEAKVALRPFTLFVGPSNTGKSYLAVLIYALHRLLGRGIGPTRPYRIFRRRASVPPGFRQQSPTVSDNDANDLFDWVEQLSSKKKDRGAPIRLPENIAVLVRSRLASLPRSGRSVEDELSRCFGLQSTRQLIRSSGATETRVVLRSYIEEEAERAKPFEHSFDISRRGASDLLFSIPSDAPLYLTTRFIDRLVWSIDSESQGITESPEAKDFIVLELLGDLVDAVFPYIAGVADSPAHYLPADRAGVMHAHRVVVSALVESAATAGIRRTAPMPVLSGVLADFLEQLILLSDPPRIRVRERGNENLAARLEKTVLGGSVRLENRRKPEPSYPSFSYRPEGWKEDLPLMRTSSMVSELAPVVLYLRHVVGQGDVLIIEEPESHLHPAMQVEFTRLLAAAVREGVRVIMTTHSEWVLEELANLVRLSGLPETTRKTMGGGAVALEPHDVGAWLFQPRNRPRGSVVQEIPLDADSGTFAAGFEHVAAALHNRWAEISSRTELADRQ